MAVGPTESAAAPSEGEAGADAGGEAAGGGEGGEQEPQEEAEAAVEEIGRGKFGARQALSAGTGSAEKGALQISIAVPKAKLAGGSPLLMMLPVASAGADRRLSVAFVV